MRKGSMKLRNIIQNCVQLVIISAAKYRRKRAVGGRNASGIPCIVLVANEANPLLKSTVRAIVPRAHNNSL